MAFSCFRTTKARNCISLSARSREAKIIKKTSISTFTILRSSVCSMGCSVRLLFRPRSIAGFYSIATVPATAETVEKTTNESQDAGPVSRPTGVHAARDRFCGIGRLATIFAPSRVFSAIFPGTDVGCGSRSNTAACLRCAAGANADAATNSAAGAILNAIKIDSSFHATSPTRASNPTDAALNTFCDFAGNRFSQKTYISGNSAPT